MYLDAVNLTTEVGMREPAVVGRERTEVCAPWNDWPPSMISHHGRHCCETAREWLLAMDFSELNGAALSSGPRWLRSRYRWGASSFPIFWCEAVERETLDCGALAAFAHEVFAARGVQSYRVQMVQRFSRNSARQWNQSWNDSDEPLKWIDDDLIYHEGCAIRSPRERRCHETTSHVFEMKGHDHSNGNGHKLRDASVGGKVIDFDAYKPSANGYQTSDGMGVQDQSSIRHRDGVPLEIWDASCGWWSDPCVIEGYGSMVALKINVFNAKELLRWGRHLIRPNEWTRLK